MNPHIEFERSLSRFVRELFPDWRVVIAFTNAPEPQTPYLAIKVDRLDELGREYTSMGGEVSSGHAPVQVVQNYAAKVVFELLGKYDPAANVSDMAYEFSQALRTPRGYDALRKHSLTLHRRPSLRRIPMLRETDMFQIYQLTCTIAFAFVDSEEREFTAGADIHGTLYDAGRKPDHKIDVHFDVNFEH